jgi:uncharacterized protein
MAGPTAGQSKANFQWEGDVERKSKWGEELNLFSNCSGVHLTNGLQWLHEPKIWHFKNEVLCVEPDGRTDAFRRYKQPAKDSACFLYVEVKGDFTLITKLRLEATAFGDAGTITIRGDEKRWAKLCIERSPSGETSIVSVVTNEWSDDANNELLGVPEAYLRIIRIGNIVGMHYSLSGETWRFVRAFGIEWPSGVKVGIQAQAPLQAGCKAYFEDLTLSKKVVRDFRGGG